MWCAVLRVGDYYCSVTVTVVEAVAAAAVVCCVLAAVLVTVMDDVLIDGDASYLITW
jgi:hypothetical protein